MRARAQAGGVQRPARRPRSGTRTSWRARSISPGWVIGETLVGAGSLTANLSFDDPQPMAAGPGMFADNTLLVHAVTQPVVNDQRFVKSTVALESGACTGISRGQWSCGGGWKSSTVPRHRSMAARRRPCQVRMPCIGLNLRAGRCQGREQMERGGDATVCCVLFCRSFPPGRHLQHRQRGCFCAASGAESGLDWGL